MTVIELICFLYLSKLLEFILFLAMIKYDIDICYLGDFCFNLWDISGI